MNRGLRVERKGRGEASFRGSGFRSSCQASAGFVSSGRSPGPGVVSLWTDSNCTETDLAAFAAGSANRVSGEPGSSEGGLGSGSQARRSGDAKPRRDLDDPETGNTSHLLTYEMKLSCKNTRVFQMTSRGRRLRCWLGLGGGWSCFHTSLTRTQVFIFSFPKIRKFVKSLTSDVTGEHGSFILRREEQEHLVLAVRRMKDSFHSNLCRQNKDGNKRAKNSLGTISSI